MIQETLHPKRFRGMSPKMAAIVGFILDIECTNPSIAEMAITSDGFVIARHKGDAGMNDMMGTETDLSRNWSELLAAAELSPDDRKAAQDMFQNRIQRF